MKKKKAKPKSAGRDASPTQPHHHHCRNHAHKKTVIKQYEEMPSRFRSKIDPLNLEEQKLQFLKHGQVPRFQFKVTAEKIEELSHTKRAEIEFGLLDEAVRILDKVRQKYGTGSLCIEQMYGERITADRASRKLTRYLQQNGADGHITIGWTKDQTCSAKMAWCGPSMKLNRPEARKYSLWLKDSTDNLYLRERGILCLADHEIGTHFLRSMNDGLQPWFSNRENFGLRKIRSHHLLETEEGLATVNTLVQANQKYLWLPALIYYTACKAATMSFEELFSHLGHYIENRELRWRYVMRVKRSLPDPDDVGGYGNDQCYFKGAAQVLRNLDSIDFRLLYAGKVCLESLPRIQRTARLECIRLPHFMQDMAAYRKTLRTIASVNGFNTSSKSSSPSKSRGLAAKQKKTRLRGASVKRCKRSAAKENVEQHEVASTLDDDTPEHSVIRDDQDEDDVIFNRTYNHFAGSSSPPCETFKGNATLEAKQDSSGNTHFGCAKSFIQASDRAMPTPAATKQDSSTFHSHQRNGRLSPELRCHSQPTTANRSIEKHHTHKATTPSPRANLRSKPRLSQLSPASVVGKSVDVRSPSIKTSPTQSRFKWGAAERPGSPLFSSMPNVSSRYNREKTDSPVPFSSHRWLLWRRDKCAPNSLNS